MTSTSDVAKFRIVTGVERDELLVRLLSLAGLESMDWWSDGAEVLWDYGTPIPWNVLSIGCGGMLEEALATCKLPIPKQALAFEDGANRLLEGLTTDLSRFLVDIFHGSGAVVFDRTCQWALIINHSGVLSYLQHTE